MALLIAVHPWGAALGGEDLGSSDRLRIAFTSSMFTEVNESDARAAMKVWIMTVAKERNLDVDPEPRIYRGVEEALAASRSNRVNGFAFTAPEYARAAKEIPFDRVAVGTRGDEILETYVLLVRDDSRIERVDQFEKATLTVLRNPRMSLAMTWLDTVLAQKGLKLAANFFARIDYSSKATKVALPVFFHQATAGLMTRRSFEVMSEMNPQVGKQLRILAASPSIVPSCFAFRSDYRMPQRETILAEMQRLSESPAGRQILTLTQSDRIEEHPVSCLNSALELLALHDRLCPNVSGAMSAGVGTAVGGTAGGAK